MTNESHGKSSFFESVGSIKQEVHTVHKYITTGHSLSWHVSGGPAEDDMYLDPARIYMTGTRDAKERMSLIRIIREGGATREAKLKDQITHIVV